MLIVCSSLQHGASYVVVAMAVTLAIFELFMKLVRQTMVVVVVVPEMPLFITVGVHHQISFLVPAPSIRFAQGPQKPLMPRFLIAVWG
jgi:hypothetical protein